MEGAPAGVNAEPTLKRTGMALLRGRAGSKASRDISEKSGDASTSHATATMRKARELDPARALWRGAGIRRQSRATDPLKNLSGAGSQTSLEGRLDVNNGDSQTTSKDTEEAGGVLARGRRKRSSCLSQTSSIRAQLHQRHHHAANAGAPRAPDSRSSSTAVDLDPSASDDDISTGPKPLDSSGPLHASAPAAPATPPVVGPSTPYEFFRRTFTGPLFSRHAPSTRDPSTPTRSNTASTAEPSCTSARHTPSKFTPFFLRSPSASVDPMHLTKEDLIKIFIFAGIIALVASYVAYSIRTQRETNMRLHALQAIIAEEFPEKYSQLQAQYRRWGIEPLEIQRPITVLLKYFFYIPRCAFSLLFFFIAQIVKALLAGIARLAAVGIVVAVVGVFLITRLDRHPDNPHSLHSVDGQHQDSSSAPPSSARNTPPGTLINLITQTEAYIPSGMLRRSPKEAGTGEQGEVNASLVAGVASLRQWVSAVGSILHQSSSLTSSTSSSSPSVNA